MEKQVEVKCHFADNVRIIAKKRGLKMFEVAELCGVAPATLTQFLMVNNPYYTTLKCVAIGLGIHESELLKEPDDESLSIIQGPILNMHGKNPLEFSLRLELTLDHLEKTPLQFAKLINVSLRNIQLYLTGHHYPGDMFWLMISKSSIKNVIDLDWLRTGNGTMIK